MLFAQRRSINLAVRRQQGDIDEILHACVFAFVPPRVSVNFLGNGLRDRNGLDGDGLDPRKTR